MENIVLSVRAREVYFDCEFTNHFDNCKGTTVEILHLLEAMVFAWWE
jgi:hypothetical protein